MKLRVNHALGHTEYASSWFKVDDASAVLLVFEDPQQKRVLAAFNREAWLSAEFIYEEDTDGHEDHVEH